MAFTNLVMSPDLRVEAPSSTWNMRSDRQREKRGERREESEGRWAKKTREEREEERAERRKKGEQIPTRLQSPKDCDRVKRGGEGKKVIREERQLSDVSGGVRISGFGFRD
jgi:hypothetical protein